VRGTSNCQRVIPTDDDGIHASGTVSTAPAFELRWEVGVTDQTGNELEIVLTF
jgi:hypothetical protein